MEIIKTVLASVMRMLSYRLTFGEFSFSLISVIIGLSIIGLIFWFIGKIFS